MVVHRGSSGSVHKGSGAERTIESVKPGGKGQEIWPVLDVDGSDIRLLKNRYSALISGSSSLERVLRSHQIDTLLIAGTKTNVCCEATGRDAVMLDFKTVILSDCCAALSDDEHRSDLLWDCPSTRPATAR